MSSYSEGSIRIAICEDNEIQREIMLENLRRYAENHPEISLYGFESGQSLLDAIKSGMEFDIYLLDILMPGINGMEVASTLRTMHDDGVIIFTTATVYYAVMSYEVHAFYYMTKPVAAEKLSKVMDNALNAIGIPRSETLMVKTNQGLVSIELEEILYVEVKDRSAVFYLKDGREYRSVSLRRSFRETVPQLFGNELFASCGVSRLVNLSCIDSISRESLKMSNGQTVYFPKSTYPDLLKRWTEHRSM